MAVTRLERKGRKNKARAKARVKQIKLLNQRPPIKNVDVEAIKAEFAKNAAAKSAKKTEAPVAEVAAEVVAEEAPKAKKKAPAKKKEESAE
jgi:hypothetical protein